MKSNTRKTTASATHSDRRNPFVIEPLEGRIAPAATVNLAVGLATGGDLDADGVPDPGDRLHYTVTVQNAGPGTLTGMSFTELLNDPNLALVAGSINVSPLAIDESFTAVGNTLLRIGGSAGSGPEVFAAGSLTANDFEFLGDTSTISAFDATSAQGGTVSVAANGSFTYLPAVGFSGADSFTYTLRDDGIDGIAGNADDLTGTATVSITVANKVWYVDSTAAAGGTGTSALPFNTVTAFTTVNNGVGTTHPAAGDTVYVRERAGDYDGNVTLLNNQQLIGSGVDLIVGGFTLLTATGKTTMVTTVAATNAITLASGDTVRGFDIGNTTGAGIFGGNVGALTINTVGKTGTGKIIDLTGAAGNNVAVTLDTASTTNSATEGIKLTGIIGSFTATTGAISGVAGTDVLVTGGTAVVSIGSSITNTAGRSVVIDGHGTGNVTLSSTISDTGLGILVQNNTSGTIAFSGATKTLNTGVNPAVNVSSNTGATINFTGGGLAITTTSGAGFSATGGGTIGVTTGASPNTIASTSGTALNVVSTTIGAGGLTFRSIASNGAASGIILNATGAGGLTVTGDAGATNNGSGGVIQNSTGVGISLTTTGPISLGYMNVTNSGTDGIKGSGINGFTLNRSNVTDAATGGATGATDDGVDLANVSGAVTFTSNLIDKAPHNDVQIDNFNTNMASFTMTGNTVSNDPPTNPLGNDGVLLTMRGTSVLPFGNIQNNTFSGMRAVAVQIHTNDSGRIGVNNGAATITALDATNSIIVQNNTFTGNGQGVDVASSQISNLTFQVLNNTIVAKVTVPNAIANTASSNAINAFTAAGADTGPTTHSFVGKIDGNIIGTQGVKDSGSGFGSGIRAVVQGQSTQGIVTINNNTIREVPNATIINIFGQNGNATNSTASAFARFKVTNNNMPAISGSNLSLGGPANTPIADTGIFVLADEGFPVSAVITGNTIYDVSTANGSFDIYLAVRTGPPAGAQLRIEGTGSVSAFTLANNTLAGANKFIDEGAGSGTPSTLVAPGSQGAYPLFFAPALDEVIMPPLTIADEPVTPLVVDETTPPVVVQPPEIVEDGILSQAELDALVGAAIARWEATGLTPEQSALLHSAHFSVGELPGWYLGQAGADGLTLDLDAAGNGWFVDSTPLDDAEYANGRATLNGGAAGRVDAMTTVMHELGHVLGLDDRYATADAGDLMYGFLSLGDRRAPVAHQADGAVPHAGGGLDFLFGSMSLGAATMPVGKGITIVYDATINAALSNGLAPNVSSQVRFTSAAGNVDSNTVVTALDSLTLGDRVWNDLSRDGIFQSATESGVDGVVMNLYVDNGTTAGSFDAGDTFVATRTTAGGGLYSFTGLLPGEYIAQVAQSNFNAGGALAALPLSSPGQPDPDNNTDNDDNGAILAGSGAVSQAITLAYNTEITAGTGNDTNNTLDFGFMSQVADLQITKTDGSATEVPGTNVTYTIVVTNAGPSDVTGATVADTFAASLSSVTWTAVAAGGATGTLSGSGNISELVNLPSGATVTYTVTGLVSATATGSLVNTATVTAPAGVTDPTPGNNSATDSDTLTPQGDLSITKTDGATTEVPGTTVTYTIVATNAGPSTVTGATVADTFAASLSSVTWTAVFANGATGTASGSGNLSELVTLPTSGTATYTVTGTIASSATGSLVNTATITAPGGFTDATPGNNSATDTDTLTPQGDLTITKTNGSATEVPGTTTTYTIVVANTGPSNVTGATVADTFAGILSGVTWISVAAGGATGNTASGSGNIGETVNLPSGGSITYTVTGTIAANATGTLVNTATVTAPGTFTDTVPGNNSATDTDTLTPQADLSITKTDGSTTEVPGTSVTYTIVVTNSGPSSVTGATVADTFAGILSGVTWTSVAAGGATGNTASSSGNISETVNLPSGSSITYTATGNISATATGTLANTATVTAPGGVTDTTPGNNSATDTDTLTPQGDLTITKTDGVTTAVPGGTTTYTIVASNNGPSTVTGATVADTFPASLSSVTWTAVFAGGATGTAGGSGNISQSVTIPSGGSVTYTATGTISGTATGSLSNTATVSAPGGFTDGTPGNNSATDTDTLTPTADLSITKNDTPDPVIPGGALSYTIVVSNSGPSTATSATFADTFPAAFTGATWTAVFAGGATGTASGSGNISQSITVPSGGTATYTILGTASAGAAGSTISNTATITAPGGVSDPTPVNNSATATTFIGGTDLTLTKTDGTTSTTTGSTLTYVLTYQNAGFVAASGVTITETLPTGTTIVLAENPGWTQIGATNQYRFNVAGTIAVGAPASTVNFIVHTDAVAAAGLASIFNTATIADDGASGGDITPANNTATDTDTLNAAPDFALTKTDSITTTTPGSTLSYTLNFSNSGNQNATGVVLTETVPVGTTFNAGASTAGWIAQGGGVFTLAVGALAGGGAGGSATFAVNVTNPAAAGLNTIGNSASIADDAANGADATPGNNSATDTDTLNAAPDLTLTKTDGVISTTPGSTLSYTLSYANAGNQGATGVVLTETVPVGTTFNAGASTAGWVAQGGGVFTLAIGALAGGGSGSAIFAVDVTNAAAAGLNSIVDTASIADDGGNGADTNTANNTATDTDTLDAAPDLTLTKTDGVTSTTPGSTLSYTLSYANAGNQGATGVVLTETLPVGTTFNVGTSAAGWTAQGGGVFTLAVGALAGGGSGSAVFAVDVTSPAAAGLATIDDTASIADDSANGADPNAADNTASDTDTLNAAPDLTLTKTDGVTFTTTGSLLTYTLSYANAGNQGATGVVLTETLPTGTSFNSAGSTAGWTETAAGSGVFTLAIGALAGGGNGTAAFAVNVTNPAAAGLATIVNNSSLADDGGNGKDATPADNAASDTDTLNAAPDLTISISDSPTQTKKGGTVAYTITYANNGTQDATGVVLTETLPANTSFNAGASTAGWVAQGGGVYTLAIGNLAAGAASGSAVFAVNVNAVLPAGFTQLSNTGSIADDAANGADTTAANNSDTETTPIYQGIYVVSPGVAQPAKFAPPSIRVFDPGTGAELFSFLAYEATYRDSIRVAVGDMNGDGYDDIITTTAKGTGRLRVFDGLTGVQFTKGPFSTEIAVFDGKKDKGAFVAAGDVTGDGQDDIIVGSALGGGKLRVIDGLTGLQISDTQPFGKTFRGGIRVAVGDVNGDGLGDIIAGQGYYGAQVKVFSGATTTVLHDFKIGVKSYRGGVSVAAGDMDGDGKADIIAGRNSGKPTQVEVFSGLTHLAIGGPILPFDANPLKPKYTLGVRVAVVDVNFDGIADIITAAGGKGASQVKIFDGATHAEILGRSFTAYAAFPNSALFVAGSSPVPMAMVI